MPEDHSLTDSKDEDSNYFQNVGTYLSNKLRGTSFKKTNILITINNSKYPTLKIPMLLFCTTKV
jgi:hypothetical protein